ncbi:MAG: PAS domain S-box protein, partial [Rhodocyclaceae bacterium]
MAEAPPNRGTAPTGERLFIAFALVFIAAIVAGTGYTLYRTRHEALDKHLDATAMQARSAEGYLTQSVDLVHLTIQDVLAATRAATDADTAHANLERAARTLPFVRSFSLADPAGRIWASSNPENVGRIVAMDAYLPAAREDGEFLRFGVPWAGRDFADGREATTAEQPADETLTFIPIARASVVDDKPIIVLVALNPDYFLNHFTQDEAPLGSTLEVLRLDSRLLLSTDPTDRPGTTHTNDLPLTANAGGTFAKLSHDYANHGPTLTAYRHSRRYPIVVTVHLPQGRALEKWADEMRTVVTLAMVSMLSILVLCAAIVRRLRRTTCEEAEANARLDLAAKVFESADEAIMVSDPQKRIVSVNPAFERVTGFPAAEVVGHTAHVIFPDPRMAPVYDRIAGEVDQKGSWQGEVVTRHKDGHPIYEWLTVSTVRDSQGAVIHFVGFLKDLTKLKSVEEQVRKLSLAVEQSPSSIVITDVSGRIEYVNRCFTEVSGYSAEEAIGQNPRLLQSGNTPPEVHKALWTALAAGRSWEGEFINRRKDGSEYVEHATVSPVRQPDGQITHYLAVKHDITERKRLERALRDNESRLRLALEGLGDGVWDWDIPSGRIYFSRHWLEMLGYREEDLPGDVRAWARLIHPEDREINRALLDAHLDDETPVYNHEYRLLTKSGQWKWILVRGAVIARANDGSPNRMLGTHVDISQRKVLEENLLAATHAAEAANRAKSEFLANMSHEIRTPMNAILGLTDLMMDSAASAEQREHLDLVHRSAVDLLAIINEILDFSKIEAGMLQLDEINFELRQCVEAAISTLAPRARDKGLRLSFAVAPEVPHTACGDPLRLRQVLINLIGNAIKFTDRGDISVGVGPVLNAANPDEILFSVADTGIGIPIDKQAIVFEAFSQADASTTRRFGGTGLGLPISRRIVEGMGGR